MVLLPNNPITAQFTYKYTNTHQTNGNWVKSAWRTIWFATLSKWIIIGWKHDFLNNQNKNFFMDGDDEHTFSALVNEMIWHFQRRNNVMMVWMGNVRWKLCVKLNSTKSIISDKIHYYTLCCYCHTMLKYLHNWIISAQECNLSFYS